jgi:hypothetical protein
MVRDSRRQSAPGYDLDVTRLQRLDWSCAGLDLVWQHNCPSRSDIVQMWAPPAEKMLRV